MYKQNNSARCDGTKNSDVSNRKGLNQIDRCDGIQITNYLTEDFLVYIHTGWVPNGSVAIDGSVHRSCFKHNGWWFERFEYISLDLYYIIHVGWAFCFSG